MTNLKLLTDDQIRYGLQAIAAGFTRDDLERELLARAEKPDTGTPTKEAQVLVALKEVAQYLGVSIRQVGRCMEDIPCYYVGRKRLWRTDVLDAWMKAGGFRRGDE